MTAIDLELGEITELIRFYAKGWDDEESFAVASGLRTAL